ncbi:uncharacterized protein LOC119685640 [Teleopsis dalmanni]|uniref:uncharacterized protein LOC119685640 n=1 Tax=Teleopsis dalmanni TaxID=139649 RepID=UPI0018CDBA0B|nr:uncharacterized protein LOC119685640 [Teleopsis dalmanni]
MTTVVKRGRGRPRREEPQEIEEADMLLVQEYQRRPVFYDRTHQHYRERDFVEEQWIDMACKLHSTVGIIKERLNTLRSRYYLEKRRVESTGVPSTWLLFEHLSFLGQHIKSRLANAPVQLINNNGTLAEVSDYDDYQNMPSSENQSIKVRGSNLPGYHIAQKLNISNDVNGNSTPNLCSQLKIRNDNKKPYSKTKYKAFGNFVACSLIHMEEKDSMRLMEKFANELTRLAFAEGK